MGLPPAAYLAIVMVRLTGLLSELLVTTTVTRL
jgi:hypothetical protein